MKLDLDITVDAETILSRLTVLEMVLSPTFLEAFLSQDVTSILRRRAAQRFNQEGRLAGEAAWKPLAPRTQEDRRALGYGPKHPINKRTGDLERFVTGNDGEVRGGDDPSLTWPTLPSSGETRKKLEVAQRGKKGTKRGGYTPKRQVVRFTDRDMNEILYEAKGFLRKGGVEF